MKSVIKPNNKQIIILVIYPIVAALSYSFYLFDIISFSVSSMIGAFAFVFLGLNLIILQFFEKKEKYSLILLVIFITFLLISSILFFGLNEKSSRLNEKYLDDSQYFEKFIGKWEGFWTTITFTSDGNIYYELYYGTWQLKNGKLITNVSSENLSPKVIIYNFSFSKDYKTLTLVDEEGRVNVYNRFGV